MLLMLKIYFCTTCSKTPLIRGTWFTAFKHCVQQQWDAWQIFYRKPQFFSLEISGLKVVENFRCTGRCGSRVPIGTRALRLQPHQPHGWCGPVVWSNRKDSFAASTCSPVGDISSSLATLGLFTLNGGALYHGTAD